MATSDAYELWEQSGHDGETYRALMREHGLIRDLKPGEKAEPLPCGWPTRRVADSPELAAAQAQVERLLAICKLATQLRAEHSDWREGQAAFNALREIDPDCALGVVSTAGVDPFYDDSRLDAFWEFVTEWTGEQT